MMKLVSALVRPNALLRTSMRGRVLAGLASLVLLVGALAPGALRIAAGPRADIASLADLCLTRVGPASGLSADADGSSAAPADHERPCCSFCLPVAGPAGLPASAASAMLPEATSLRVANGGPAEDHAAPRLLRAQPRAPPRA